MNALYALSENLLNILALFGLLVFIVAIMGFRNVKMTTRTMTNTALLVAVATILHQIVLFHMPQGGSVTAGVMVPLLILSYRYGPSVGALGGFLYGIINLIQDPYFVHPIQVLFDYPLPFVCLGIAGLKINNNFVIPTAVAFFNRFLCHVISGVIFFSEYAPQGTSPLMYSIIFNGTYLLPDIVICCIIMKFMPLKRIMAAMKE